MATAAMRKSWLIQRLERPLNGKLGALKDNPFSFGGGLRNGGLSNEAMDLLRPIFSFSYMGAAEYEWGKVPEALNKIAGYAQDRKLVAFDISAPWAPLYVICAKAHRKEVEERVEGWARGNGPEVRDPIQMGDSYAVGWLELDNGFLFFTDEDMWRGAAHLFGVEV